MILYSIKWRKSKMLLDRFIERYNAGKPLKVGHILVANTVKMSVGAVPEEAADRVIFNFAIVAEPTETLADTSGGAANALPVNPLFLVDQLVERRHIWRQLPQPVLPDEKRKERRRRRAMWRG